MIYLTPVFIAPKHFSEQQYHKLKTAGINPNSALPGFFKYYRSKFFVIGACTTILTGLYIFGAADNFKNIASLLLAFLVVNLGYNTYRFFKFRRKEKKFKERLTQILNDARSYMDFEYLYNYEVNYSRLGKTLIKNYYTKGQNTSSIFIKNSYLSNYTYSFLLNGKTPIREVGGWLFNEGLSEEDALRLLNMNIRMIKRFLRLK